MPRNLGFNLETARAAILREFWLRGYEGTSLTDLERATSLVRTSLYNSFGNKPDMFLDSLKLYHQSVEAQIDAATNDRGIDALAEVIAAMMEGSDRTAGQPAGCLMVSAATHSAALEDRHLQLVRGYRQMLSRKARTALDRDRASGRLGPTIDIESTAEFLVCVVWGALAAQCLNEGTNPAAAGAAVLRKTMESWLDN
ncbi:MAG: TetR/AcrR family transcriptional regulator [Pseudomonadota bacterium]